MAGKHRAGSGRHRVTETSDYVAMMKRVMYGYGRRIGTDPAALAHLRELERSLVDATNLGCYLANSAQHDHPYSLADMSSILGVTRQSIHHRVKAGRWVALKLGEGPAVRVAEVRAGRAAALAAAGLDDRTGSDRERASA